MDQWWIHWSINQTNQPATYRVKACVTASPCRSEPTRPEPTRARPSRPTPRTSDRPCAPSTHATQSFYGLLSHFSKASAIFRFLSAIFDCYIAQPFLVLQCSDIPRCYCAQSLLFDTVLSHFLFSLVIFLVCSVIFQLLVLSHCSLIQCSVIFRLAQSFCCSSQSFSDLCQSFHIFCVIHLIFVSVIPSLCQPIHLCVSHFIFLCQPFHISMSHFIFCVSHFIFCVTHFKFLCQSFHVCVSYFIFCVNHFNCVSHFIFVWAISYFVAAFNKNTQSFHVNTQPFDIYIKSFNQKHTLGHSSRHSAQSFLVWYNVQSFLVATVFSHFLL
jgi:hypothetical protein